MSTVKEMTPTAYFAALKEAADPQAYQELVLGTAYDDRDALNEAYEALVEEAEEAGDDEEFEQAAEAFRKVSVLAWAQGDNRLTENFSIQALYYGTLANFDTLLENYATVWAMWAHMLPGLKARDRARLQDFARFRRSFELGLRERQETEQRFNATVSLLAPTFDSVGTLNSRAIDDRKADLTTDTGALWDEVGQLINRIETSSA